MWLVMCKGGFYDGKSVKIHAITIAMFLHLNSYSFIFLQFRRLRSCGPILTEMEQVELTLMSSFLLSG